MTVKSDIQLKKRYFELPATLQRSKDYVSFYVCLISKRNGKKLVFHKKTRSRQAFCTQKSTTFAARSSGNR